MKRGNIMRFTFTGKNIVVSEAMKDRTTKKIGRLEKLLPSAADITVTFSVVKQDNTIEVTIPLGKRVLRAEVTKTDWFAAIDEVVDILERQMVKFKKRLKDKSRRDVAFKAEMTTFFEVDDSIDDEPASETESQASSIKIERTKRFALKPMDEEEAVMEMELLGHVFFVFRNSKTGDVNVVYKRNDGTYGLISPE
jgi:putative sigma-54 modulation protein